MKKLLLIIPAIGILFLCSFVDPSEVNVYSGTLSGSGRFNGYTILFYVNDSSHLSRDQNGILINTDRYSVSGRGMINNAEFDIVFPSNSSINIMDSNIGTGYNLMVNVSPSHFALPIWVLYITVLSSVIILIYIILRGIMQ